MLRTMAIVGVLIVLSGCTQSPAEEAKSVARYAISNCWDTQKAKSNEPSEARFIAGACEKMERDFQKTYGFAP